MSILLIKFQIFVLTVNPPPQEKRSFEKLYWNYNLQLRAPVLMLWLKYTGSWINRENYQNLENFGYCKKPYLKI